MGMNELVGKKIILELKNGSKYFGVLVEIDESPKAFSWIVLKDKFGKTQTFSDSETIRVEEDLR
jgi:small nuclear ribonucleoprotein (snRNP)-like protein